MHITIDIGNSRVKIHLFKNPEEGALHYHGPVTGIDLERFLQESPALSGGILVRTGKIPEGWTRILKQHLNKFILLGPDTPLPVKNRYRSKTTLGYDRIAAVSGAHALYPGKNVLVIDAGTALTSDLVTHNGVYMGGTISPGLSMRFKALATFTENLPEGTPEIPVPFPGDETKNAIISGVMTGFFAETDQLINRYREMYDPLVVVATGGEAFFFDKNLKNSIFVRPDLVAVGLNRILEINEEN